MKIITNGCSFIGLLIGSIFVSSVIATTTNTIYRNIGQTTVLKAKIISVREDELDGGSVHYNAYLQIGEEIEAFNLGNNYQPTNTFDKTLFTKLENLQSQCINAQVYGIRIPFIVGSRGIQSFKKVPCERLT